MPAGPRRHAFASRPDRVATAPHPGAPDEDWLRARYLVDGLSTQLIAEQLGCSSQYIRDTMRRYGIPLRPRGGGAKSGQTISASQLAVMVTRGDSVAQIAALTGFSPSGVYKMLRRDQLTLGRRATATAPVEADLREQIVHLYVTEQASVRSIATTVHRSSDWVRSRLIDAGVTLRTHAEQRALSSVDHVDIEARLRTGQTIDDIAAATSRSAETVRQLARTHGWPLPRHGPPRRRPSVPPLDAATLQRLYVGERRTINEIAQRLGCSAHRVRTSFAAAGIVPRAPGRRDDTRPAPITAATLTDLYIKQQLSVPTIAEQLGCSTNRIRTAMTQHGIPFRPRYTRLPPLPIDRETLTDLYVDQHLDDDAIAADLDVSTFRVRTRRRELGVTRPPVPPPHPASPTAPPAGELARLYSETGTPIAAIARSYRTSTPTVRRWLIDAGIPVRARTARSHRRQLDPTLLRELYADRQWSAAQIAADQDTTVHAVLRNLHDNAIPVRRGGPPGRDNTPVRLLIGALYADPQVSAFLRRHDIPRRTRRGTIAVRFPTPVEVTNQMLREAYVDLGLSARQIELITGQPADQLLDQLRDADIPARHAAPLSPWLARQFNHDLT